jgi:hypothetical protein
MMKQLICLTSFVALCVFLGGSALRADTIVTDGLATPPWGVGATVPNGSVYDAAVAGQPAPFNAFHGNINATNFSATWTFSYTPPAKITGATISLGLIYAPASSDTTPAASFTLDGTINLTSLLNTEMNAVHAPGFDDLYEIETITIPSTDLAALGTSPATFTLDLQGPGQGKFGTGPDMQAAIVNSTLDLKTGSVSPPPTPEPATFFLFFSGLAMIGLAVRHRASHGR